MVAEDSAALGGATEILPQQVQDALVPDDLGQLIQEQKVVDRGVVGFDIGAQHEVVGGQMRRLEGAPSEVWALTRLSLLNVADEKIPS